MVLVVVAVVVGVQDTIKAWDFNGWTSAEPRARPHEDGMHEITFQATTTSLIGPRDAGRNGCTWETLHDLRTWGGGTWEFWSRFPFTKRGVNECYKENRIVLIRCRSSLSCLDARVVVSWNIHWTSAKMSAGCSTENMVEQVERESSWNFTECTIFIIIIFFYN